MVELPNGHSDRLDFALIILPGVAVHGQRRMQIRRQADQALGERGVIS